MPKKPLMNETEQKPDNASKFEAGKTHAKQAAEALRAAAEEKASQLRAAAEAKAAELRSTAEAKVKEYRHRAEEGIETVRNRANSLRQETENYVRENPLRGVLTALGIGFVLGLIFRR